MSSCCVAVLCYVILVWYFVCHFGLGLMYGFFRGTSCIAACPGESLGKLPNLRACMPWNILCQPHTQWAALWTPWCLAADHAVTSWLHCRDKTDEGCCNACKTKVIECPTRRWRAPDLWFPKQHFALFYVLTALAVWPGVTASISNSAHSGRTRVVRRLLLLKNKVN